MLFRSTSCQRGLRRSAGMMVNYVYRLNALDRNHEAYAREHRVVAVRRIEALAKESVLARGDKPAVRSRGAAKMG